MNVQAEVLSTVGGVSEVKVSWESEDPAADSWAVAVNGFPVARIEGLTRSVNVTDIYRDEDVLLEIFVVSAAGKVGDRVGTTLAAAG